MYGKQGLHSSHNNEKWQELMCRRWDSTSKGCSSLAQKIDRNCGGASWLEETEGGGCTFWVELEDAPRS